MHGWEAVHWSSVGDPGGSNEEIMDWVATHRHVVFTHDLDLGTMLSLSHQAGPSALQVRTQDTLPDYLERPIVAALSQHETDLSTGALVVVDESRSRILFLPI